MKPEHIEQIKALVEAVETNNWPAHITHLEMVAKESLPALKAAIAGTPEGYAVVPVNDDQARYRADISGNDFLNTAFNNGGRPVAIDLFDIMIEAMLKAAEGERTLEESGLRKG